MSENGMRYAKLGGTDLVVSAICLGCMGFGDSTRGQHSWTVDENASRAIVRSALDAGINFFDTAIAYQSGTSEQFLGRALRDFARRDEVVVATKFLPRTDEEIATGIDGRAHVGRMLDASLRNLGMDHVDLYIYHLWDYRTPLREIMQGLADAVAQGKTRHVGISNCFAWQLAQANALADAEGFPRFASMQGHYNLLFREEEREMIPLCRQEGIALTPYSPLAGGRLSKLPGEESKRLREDAYARQKYDGAAALDRPVIERWPSLPAIEASAGADGARVARQWRAARHAARRKCATQTPRGRWGCASRPTRSLTWKSRTFRMRSWASWRRTSRILRERSTYGR
ncbi:MAG: aldo/keto reductase [Eggerthellaceae bacterium]